MTVHSTDHKLSKQQRRELKKLGREMDRVSEDDRLFFERLPHRQHRIRLASQAEINEITIIEGEDQFVPDGYFAFNCRS
jgi:hypothetical protein